jgi:tetratricopeptide (TPR) repeat protein
MGIWQKVLNWIGLASEPTPLERARELLSQGQLEDAILIARDILFSTLTSLSRAANIAMPPGGQDERAYALNESLGEMGVYAEPMYHQIQQWIRLGVYTLEGTTEEITLGSAQDFIENLIGFTRVVKATLEAAGYSAAQVASAPTSTPPPSPLHTERVPVPYNNAKPNMPRREPALKRPIPASPPVASPPRPREADPGLTPYPTGDAAPTVIGTLPRVSGFVGRGHTVMRLAGLLRQRRHVALVPLENGMAGMGLSSIVAETLWLLEQDLPPTFPGGMLALHCYNREGEESLRWIFNEISMNWHIPAIAQATSMSAQMREVRRLFSGQPVLIVLDQVEMGLPIQRLMDVAASTNVTICLTSRFVPKADQLSIMRLEPLAQGPSLTLFQERFTRAAGVSGNMWDEESARLICQHVEYRPLAIELAAALTSSGPLTLSGLAQRLEMIRSRNQYDYDTNQIMRYLLDLMYQSFDRTEQNRLASLAIFAGPTWSEDAALAILNTIEPASIGMGSESLYPTSMQTNPLMSQSAVETLRGFVRRYLVQIVPSNQSGIRYRLHPFVRGIATQLLIERQIIMNYAGQAMAGHYAGVALNRRKQRDQALMQEEYLHMEAGLLWAYANNESELVVSYGMGLFRFWQRNGLWQDGANYLNRAVQAAQLVGDRPREAVLAQELATIELSCRNRARGRSWYEHSLNIWRALGNRKNEADVLFDLGRLTQEDNDPYGARSYFQNSLDAARDSGDDQGQARALQALGLIAESFKQFDEARNYYEQVFEMRQRAHDPVGQAGALNVLGVLEYRQKRYNAAFDLLTASLNNALDAQNDFWEAEARFWLGETASAMGNAQEAASQWQRALALYVRLGRARDVQETQRRLATIGGTTG